MTRFASLPGLLAGFLWFQLGKWLERRGLPAVAETCFRHVSVGQGEAAAEGSFRLSQRLLARGCNEETVSVCEEALRHAPDHARLWCALGAARRRLAHPEPAREAYEKALALDPCYAQAWCNLGEWQMTVGEDHDKALASFERALQLNGDLLEAVNNRVAALYELGRFKDAEAAAKEAIESHPGVAALHVNLGTILLHSGKGRLALKAFYKALECDPACAEAHLALATAFGELQRIGEAQAFLEHEIAIKGESAQRLASLAMAQRAKGDLLAAEATCRKVLDMQPDNISALTTLAGSKSTRGDHRESIRLNQQAVAVSPQISAIFSNIAFDATYLADIAPEEVYEYHTEWARRFESSPQEGTAAPAFPNSRDTERPLRIGYVSGDFGRHPVGFLLRDITRNHDRQRFYIHCYSMMRQDDDITADIRNNADSWIDALLLNDDELARQIRDDRIDILVDLSGHTAFNRLPVFVLRPAPVQATWIGYFHSTGLQSIDYFITDPYTSPPGCGQLFSETPVWLPHSRFCYSPPDYAPEVAPPPSLASGCITFGSFNRIEKLVDPVVDAWASIVTRVANSRLLIKSGGLQDEGLRAELRQRFVDRGIDAHRLDLRGPSPHPEMLAEYGDIDIALDPFPFNGGMTTLEALWMGVPIVTIAGHGVVSRQTYSALANIGLTELAFTDVAGYIQGTIELAGDSGRLAKVRGELRPRLASSPIRQAEQFTRDVEDLYRQMWRAYCAGEPLPDASARS